MDFNVYTVSLKGMFSNKYEVLKEGDPAYTVVRKGFLGSGDRYIQDADGYDLLCIKKSSLFSSEKFELYEDGHRVGLFSKETFKSTCYLETQEMTYSITKNTWSNELTVYDGELDIAKVSRKSLRRKDHAGIAIMEGYNDLHILAAVICVLEIIRQQSGS